jgi:hypothetical protein
MEAVRTSETSVYSNETTRLYIPEGSHLRHVCLSVCLSVCPSFREERAKGVFMKLDTGSFCRHTILIQIIDNNRHLGVYVRGNDWVGNALAGSLTYYGYLGFHGYLSCLT